MDKTVKAGLMGFIVGDALGVPVEFIDRSVLEIKPVTEMLEYGTHNVKKGTWSDDTSMVLATIDSIIEQNKIDYKDISLKF
ncbi:MAG: ADP-ribosylglycohydrolase family protein, partial [Bacilli bacterium]